MEQNRTSVPKVILTFIVGIIIFYIAFITTSFLLSLIIYLICKIRFLEVIVSILTSGFVDYPINLIAASTGCFTSSYVMEVMNKNTTQVCISAQKVLGITLIAFNILWLIVNILARDNFFVNIVLIITGAIFVNHSNKERESYSEKAGITTN